MLLVCLCAYGSVGVGSWIPPVNLWRNVEIFVAAVDYTTLIGALFRMVLRNEFSVISLKISFNLLNCKGKKFRDGVFVFNYNMLCHS